MLATSSLAAALGSHIHLAEARKKGGKKGGKHGGKHGGKNNHESPATLPGGPTTPPPGGGSCNPGLTLCGAACIDTNANVAHCGGCGHACQSGQTCQNGGCVSNQSCKTKVERKSEFLDPERYIETTATSYCDGFLRVVTFARNAHWDAGFKPRIQIMAFDA